MYHENNAGAFFLSKTPLLQYMPQKKDYSIKTIWFCEVKFIKKIRLVKIATVKKLGAMFSKDLPRVAFEYF